MKIPLNVSWHYYFHSRYSYRDTANHLIFNNTLYNYTFKNGDDKFSHQDIPIKVSQITKLIKSIPLAEDFAKPVFEDTDKNSIQNIEVIPNTMLFITLTYYTLCHENTLSFNFIKKDEDVYELSLFKEMFHLDTHKRTNKKEEKLLTKEEAMDMLSKLPETIDLGIFKLPFGNCFECKPVEE